MSQLVDDSPLGNRRDARRQQLAERLLPIVEQLIARELGFGAVSVEQILVGARLPRTTFYRYFGNKAELLIALADPVLDSILAAAVHPFVLEPDHTVERLEGDLRQTMAQYLQHLGLLGAIAELSTYDADVRRKFLAVFEAIRQTLARRLEEGQEGGFIRIDMLAWETAGWITWMAERGMTQLAATATRQERDKLAESLARLIWHGVYRTDPISRSAASSSRPETSRSAGIDGRVRARGRGRGDLHGSTDLG